MTRLYRVLLLVFPRAMRREFGDDMARMFAAQLREARKSRSRVVRLCVLALGDVLVHGAGERLAEARGRAVRVANEVRRWRWWMQAVVQDVRYAVRLLVKQPAVSAIALLTLALGVGANTAIFSAVDAVLLRPLPYPDPDRLVRVFEKRLREGVLDNPVAPADFIDWTRAHASFESIAAMTSASADLTGAGEPVRLSAGTVSPAFFDVLGVRPALGRAFLAEEAVAGRHHAVILGSGLWRQRFGSDPSVIGRSLAINGHPHLVVGVLPDSFEFPDAAIDLWVPLVLEGTPEATARTRHYLDVYARLKHGATLAMARADMDRVGAQLAAAHPEANRNHGVHVASLREELSQPFRWSLFLLLAAVSFVLLIACVNVANLLLARAASRKREMAVRGALGAGRGRLAGQALTESIVLGVAGGALGLLVARWGIDLLRTLAPRGVPILGLQHLGLEPRVLTFALTVSIASGVLFGLLPAWQVAGQDINDALKEGGRPGARGVRRRLRAALVVTEIALASMLLVGAGLTLRSFQALLNTDAGFTVDGLLTALVALPPGRYPDDARVVGTFDQIERRMEALPGVRSVGAISHLPLTGQDARAGIVIEGREPSPDEPTRAHLRSVTPGYFRTMQIALRGGRSFTPADSADATLVAIVNESMARRYWPAKSPLGARIRLAGGQAWREVVGVVADVKHWGLERQVNPELYLPQAQMAWPSLNLVVATATEPSGLGAPAREQLRAVDPDLPLSDVRTMAQVASQSVAQRRAGMMLLALFGLLALALAAAGIYGVMAHLVALRTSEIGIRVTLGAAPSRVMALVLKEGLAQAVAGVAIGIAAAMLVMRSFRAVLFQVSPADPVTLAAVALLLTVTAVAACLVPAVRALRVDPIAALRSE